MDKYKAPESLEEAQERAAQLLEEINSIQAQQKERKIPVRGGQRLPTGEYLELLEWQKRANNALRFRLRDYRRLKAYIKEHQLQTVSLRELRETQQFNPYDSESLLLFLLGVVRTLLREEYGQLSPQDAAIHEAAVNYFRRKK